MRKVLLALVLSVLPLSVSAQGPPGQKTGFSGRIQAGAFYLNTDSQLSTDDDNRRNASLGGPAEVHDTVSAFGSLYLTYGFESGTEVYLGNPMELGEGLAFAAGVRQPVGKGTLDVSVNWLPIKEVWKNPYETAIQRETSDVDARGLKITWEKVAGTPFELDYTLDGVDVDDDAIGRLEPDLRRNARIHALALKYSVRSGRGLLLKPEAGYVYGNVDGDSNSYRGLKLGILLQRAKPPFLFLGFLSGSGHAYEKSHPVFNKTRRESEVSGFVQVMRLNLFGVKRLFANVGAGYVWSDSNIDFFDSRTLIGLAGVGVNF